MVSNVVFFLSYTVCTEAQGQRFLECGTACPPVCGEEQPFFCTLQCVPGCQCPPGTCLDKDRAQCVRECLPPGLFYT